MAIDPVFMTSPVPTEQAPEATTEEKAFMKRAWKYRINKNASFIGALEEYTQPNKMEMRGEQIVFASEEDQLFAKNLIEKIEKWRHSDTFYNSLREGLNA